MNFVEFRMVLTFSGSLGARFSTGDNCLVWAVLSVGSYWEGVHLCWWIHERAWICRQSSLPGTDEFFLNQPRDDLSLKHILSRLGLFLVFCIEWLYLFMDSLFLQRLLKMLEGLNFKEFLGLLSAFSARAAQADKLKCESFIQLREKSVTCIACSP